MARGGCLRPFQDENAERGWGKELFELSQRAACSEANGAASRVGLPKTIAEIVHIVQQTALQALNKEGAWIRDYSAYFTRMTHDPDKIQSAGFDEWRGFVEPRLSGVTLEEGWVMDTLVHGHADMGKVLRHLWSALVKGEHLHDRDLSCLQDRSSTIRDAREEWLARSCSLHFRDCDAWLDYQKRFGRGKLWEQVAQTLNRAARQLALLRKFGTNPEKEFLGHIYWFQEKYKDTRPDLVAELHSSACELKMIFDTITIESVWLGSTLKDVMISESHATGEGAERGRRVNLSGYIFVLCALGLIVLGILGLVLRQ
jgi:hypothetical protein